MGEMGIIIIAVAALVFFGVLFFIIDMLNKSSSKSSSSKPKESQSKAEPKSEPKPAKSEPDNLVINEVRSPAAENDFVQERNKNNLANDIESLIEKDIKDDSIKFERASRRSSLLSAGRMRKYYEDRHMHYESKYRSYGIDDEDTEKEIEVGNLTFTEEEIKKLVALQEIMKRKDS